MIMNNFIKKVIVNVYTQGDALGETREKVFSVNSDKGFRIVFNVSKNITSDSNYATIQLYNLSDSTISIFSNKGLWIELWAGYRSDNCVNLIYAGAIQTVSVNKDEVDKICSIICRTDWNLDRKVCTYSVFSFVDLKNILFKILNDAKIPYSPTRIIVSGTSGYRGLGEINTIRNSLNNLANWFDFSWSIQDYGFLALSDDQVLPIRNDIYTPLVSTNILPRENDRTSEGYSIKCLLDGRLQVGNLVTFNSMYNGNKTFKLYKVEHRGDTHGDIWESDLMGYVPGSKKKQTNNNNGIFNFPS